MSCTSLSGTKTGELYICLFGSFMSMYFMSDTHTRAIQLCFPVGVVNYSVCCLRSELCNQSRCLLGREQGVSFVLLSVNTDPTSIT